MDTAQYVNNVGRQINMMLKGCKYHHKNCLLNIVLINHLSKLISDLNPYNVIMSECDRIKIQDFIANLKKELHHYNIQNN